MKAFFWIKFLYRLIFLMFVVGDFREYVCAYGFRCIEFSFRLNHCYDYHDSSFWLWWPNHYYDYHDSSSFWHDEMFRVFLLNTTHLILFLLFLLLILFYFTINIILIIIIIYYYYYYYFILLLLLLLLYFYYFIILL